MERPHGAVEVAVDVALAGGGGAPRGSRQAKQQSAHFYTTVASILKLTNNNLSINMYATKE
jgi:hypothetical protein